MLLMSTVIAMVGHRVRLCCLRRFPRLWPRHRPRSIPRPRPRPCGTRRLHPSRLLCRFHLIFAHVILIALLIVAVGFKLRLASLGVQDLVVFPIYPLRY